MADILIGLGGTGGRILKAFRQRLWTEFSNEARKSLPIGFIYVDATSAVLNPNDYSCQTIHGNCSLHFDEFVDIGIRGNIDYIFEHSEYYKNLSGILGDINKTRNTIGLLGTGTNQKRRAGRIMFAANIDAYLGKLTEVIHKVRSIGCGEKINIHIFTGLAGGTGSGSIIDVIAQTRKWFFDKGMNESTEFRITVFCQLPEKMPNPCWDAGRYKANGYAALLELNNLLTSHFNHEMNTMTCNPCYDVSSQIDFARLNLSNKQPTQENIDNGYIPEELKIAQGLFLYSNQNDSGQIIMNPEDLAKMVADFVYAKIFVSNVQLRAIFSNIYHFESIFREESDLIEGDDELTLPLPIRTRAIGSFGIKRIVVPESDLQDHITHLLLIKSLLQLKYNNWNTATGYSDEPNCFDAAAFLENESLKSDWKIDTDHLLLKKYILETDTHEGWSEEDFSIYWDTRIDIWAGAAKKDKKPFHKLMELCEDEYAHKFRQTGVESFYTPKSRFINADYATCISNNIEEYLFKTWEDGILSLHDISLIISQLNKEIHNTSIYYTDNIIPNLEAKCKKYEQEIYDIIGEYTHANILKSVFLFNNLYRRAVILIKLLYQAKTELIATRLFAQPLAQTLESQLCDFHKRITTIGENIEHLIHHTQTRIIANSLENKNDEIENLKLRPIIKLYDYNKLMQLENKIICDKYQVDSISHIVRNSIIEVPKDIKHFLSSYSNHEIILTTLYKKIYESAQSFHDRQCFKAEDKVLGTTIFEQLAGKYGYNENALVKFAEQVIANGVFTEINMNEILLKDANNESPEVGVNILFKHILVNLPTINNPELLKFAELLKNGFEKAVPGNTPVTINTGNKSNEITVIIIINGYPMRAISSLKALRDAYNKLLTQNPDNDILLLTEGKNEDFNDLFISPRKTPDNIRGYKTRC